MEQGRNRVFINPNFNKRICNNIPMKNMSVMHVNPNFYQHSQNVQPQLKPKIYINPNFVRPNGTNNHQNHYENTNNTLQSYVKPIPLMDSSNTSNILDAPKKYEVQSSIATSSVPTEPYQTHSRYSLVRQKKPQEPLTNLIRTQTNTIKISKYKSIKITDIKKNLDSVKPVVKVTPFKESNNHKSLIRIINNQKSIPKAPTNNINRYKFVRLTVGIGKPQLKRQISCTNKKVECNRTKIKTVGVYKKNNIPCPQYRKYGKCLRESYRKCEFIHDRKHVSICRKYINGVCHNDNCLLSHELSDKKMPTCYFYLKGMCTKEGCPYLHVKLNEKAKICLDFVRGYCEKGDKCLNRHVAKTLNSVNKRKLSLKKICQQKIIKYKLEKNKTKSVRSSTQKIKSKIHLNNKSLQECNDAGSRYYKESVKESNNSESFEIKPTRCKLGTLPSFIQL